MKRKFPKIIYFLVCLMLIFQQSGFAQIAGQLDISGYFTGLRNVFISDSFRPLHLRYISYDNLSNNLKLLLDKGDIKPSQTQELENPTKELLRYFFIGISLPNDSFWVNLRPDSPDNIIDSDLAQTDLGKVLLEADLQLKKDTANFTSPQTPEGKDYWNKLYQKANELFGGENITIPTLTRPWIVPGEIIIRETQENAYVYKATLKVMLEQDYLKDSTAYNFTDERSKKLNEYASELIRETIIPKLTKDINTAKRYAPLRQVYYSLILAHWFKDKFSGKGGLYSQLINKKNLNGLVSKELWSKDTYFQAYQKSFKEGEYNIKEPVYTLQGQTIRNYMSGGIAIGYDAIKRAISSGIEILGNSLRPLATLNHQIYGNLSPGSIQDPLSGEINIQPQETIGSSTDYLPATVKEVNYDSADRSDLDLFIKIHRDNGSYVRTGTWAFSEEVLKTSGAANCIVSVLIDNKSGMGIMGHYPYVVSKVAHFPDRELNRNFYDYLETVRSVAGVDAQYTLYLFGGAPINGSASSKTEAEESKAAVKKAFDDVLGTHITGVVDRTAKGSEVIDWLIADIKNKEITYHYTNASSPIDSAQDFASGNDTLQAMKTVLMSGEKNIAVLLSAVPDYTSELTPAGSQGILGGSVDGTGHRNYIDKKAAKWMFKEYPQQRLHRALVDDAVYKIAIRLGFEDAMKAVVVRMGNIFGTLVRWFDNQGSLWSVIDQYGNDFPQHLSKEVLSRFVKEQVLDWLVSQHDSHGGSFLKVGSSVRAIDKSQAYKYMGYTDQHAERLALDYNPNADINGAGNVRYMPIYNIILDAIRKGKCALSLEEAWQEVNSVLAEAEKLSADEYVEMLKPYAIFRFDVIHSSEERLKNSGEFLKLARARKVNLSSDFMKFYHSLGLDTLGTSSVGDLKIVASSPLSSPALGRWAQKIVFGMLVSAMSVLAITDNPDPLVRSINQGDIGSLERVLMLSATDSLLPSKVLPNIDYEGLAAKSAQGDGEAFLQFLTLYKYIDEYGSWGKFVSDTIPGYLKSKIRNINVNVFRDKAINGDCSTIEALFILAKNHRNYDAEGILTEVKLDKLIDKANQGDPHAYVIIGMLGDDSYLPMNSNYFSKIDPIALINRYLSGEINTYFDRAISFYADRYKSGNAKKLAGLLLGEANKGNIEALNTLVNVVATNLEPEEQSDILGKKINPYGLKGKINAENIDLAVWIFKSLIQNNNTAAMNYLFELSTNYKLAKDLLIGFCNYQVLQLRFAHLDQRISSEELNQRLMQENMGGNPYFLYLAFSSDEMFGDLAKMVFDKLQNMARQKGFSDVDSYLKSLDPGNIFYTNFVLQSANFSLLGDMIDSPESLGRITKLMFQDLSSDYMNNFSARIALFVEKTVENKDFRYQRYFQESLLNLYRLAKDDFHRKFLAVILSLYKEDLQYLDADAIRVIEKNEGVSYRKDDHQINYSNLFQDGKLIVNLVYSDEDAMTSSFNRSLNFFSSKGYRVVAKTRDRTTLENALRTVRIVLIDNSHYDSNYDMDKEVSEGARIVSGRNHSGNSGKVYKLLGDTSVVASGLKDKYKDVYFIPGQCRGATIMSELKNKYGVAGIIAVNGTGFGELTDHVIWKFTENLASRKYHNIYEVSQATIEELPKTDTEDHVFPSNKAGIFGEVLNKITYSLSSSSPVNAREDFLIGLEMDAIASSVNKAMARSRTGESVNLLGIYMDGVTTSLSKYGGLGLDFDAVLRRSATAMQDQGINRAQIIQLNQGVRQWQWLVEKLAVVQKQSRENIGIENDRLAQKVEELTAGGKEIVIHGTSISSLLSILASGQMAQGENNLGKGNYFEIAKSGNSYAISPNRTEVLLLFDKDSFVKDHRLVAEKDFIVRNHKRDGVVTAYEFFVIRMDIPVHGDYLKYFRLITPDGVSDLTNMESASSPLEKLNESINVFAGNSQLLPRGRTEALRAYLNVCLLVVAMDKDGNRFMAHFLPSGHIQGGLSNPELVRFYFKSYLEKLLQNMPGKDANVAIISSTKDDSLNGLLAELEKNGPAPYLITLEGIENFLKERGIDIPSARKDDKDYMKIVTFDQEGNVRISYLDNNVVKEERVIQLGEVGASSATLGASSPVELSLRQSQWAARLVAAGIGEQGISDILSGFRQVEDSAEFEYTSKIPAVKERIRMRIEDSYSNQFLNREAVRERIAHLAGIPRGTVITDEIYTAVMNTLVEKDEEYIVEKTRLENEGIRMRYKAIGEYVSKLVLSEPYRHIFRADPSIVFVVTGLLLPSIEKEEESSKLHELFTDLINRDAQTSVFKTVLSAQKGSKEQMALFNLIFSRSGDNFGNIVKEFQNDEKILLAILEVCFRNGIRQVYNEPASSPVEQKVNEIVRQAANLFNANIPSQCVDASKFIADRLEQLGIPHKILTRHIPHDASKVAEIGDATDSHTMLEVVFSNKVWVIDTQLKQFTLADRNKLKLPEEFVSRHIYQADDYYAAVPVFSDSICAERVVSATLSSDQTSSSPMNETFYNKIPIIIPEVGSLVSEGTGFNSLGTWYTEGPSERFPYGVVTKKLPTAQDARREFANLLEVSLDNPQFVQPVSLDDNSYSMEYLPGFSLQDVLDKKASLPKEISISGDLSSFARKMSRSSPERYIELQSEGKTRRFTLHEAINAAIEHSHGSMDREGVRMLTQQILQMSQGKHTENIVFPQDIEPKNIRFTPRGIVMIDAGRVILHATPIEFIMTYWVPRIMQYIVTASSPVSYSVQQTRDDNENYLAVGQGEFDIVRARDSLSVVTSIGADPCVLVVIDDRDNGISLLAHMDSNNAVADESYSAFFDALVREGTSPAGVNIHLFGADNAPSRKTGQTIKRGIEKELRKRVASFDVQGKIKEDFAGAQSRSVGIDAKEGTPFTLTKPLAHTKAAFIRGMNRRSVYGNPVQYLKTSSFAIASSPITMEQIRNKVADDSQRILVDVLTTPDEKGGRQPRTVWFDYDKRLLITVFGIDNEQFRRQLQVSVLNKTISDSERLKDVVNRIMGQPESVFGALNRYIIEVNNLDRLREESGIATRRQTRINMLNDLRDALAPLVMVSKINGYISTGKVNTRGQIEIKFTPHDLTSVRQALELLPDLDAGIWETASILLIQIEPMEGSSSPIIKDTKGGIDFRSFPVTTQPALNAQLSSMPIPRPLVSINLDESWGQIQNMLKAGIIPSNERIKEYLQTCCEKKNMEQEVDKILACIADILRLQEERVVSTDSSLKEMLALLESNKPANEMQFVLAKIIVPDKEPLAIAQ